MRIVLDTNVIVSALLVQGSIPDQVLETVISGQSQVVVDGRIIREYRTVLARPEIGFPAPSVADLLALLDASEWVIAAPLRVRLRDETDLPFLEVAVSGGVVAIVTGNTAHFQLPKGTVDIAVLTPRQYMDMLAGPAH